VADGTAACAVAVLVASAGGLPALWAALACANVLLAVGQFVSFRHHSARLAAPEPPPVGAGAPEPVRP
jgi:MATE family multidrug resistance protein